MVEPLVFVMIVSTKALAVTVTKSFFLHTHGGGGEESVEACDNEEFLPHAQYKEYLTPLGFLCFFVFLSPKNTCHKSTLFLAPSLKQ